MSHRNYWSYHCNHQRWCYRNPVAAAVRLGCYHQTFPALDQLCRWLGYLASPFRDVEGKQRMYCPPQRYLLFRFLYAHGTI